MSFYLTVSDAQGILNSAVRTLQKKHYIDSIKSGFMLIFSAALASTISQQFLDHKIEKIIQSPTGLNSMIWVWGFLSLLTALVFPLIQSLLCSFYLSREFTFEKKIKNFLADHFELTLLETLRAWGKSFLWFFVFILPGFVKYSYYMLTPFVVLFSKKYQTGHADALDVSEKIFKKYWIYFSIQQFLFYFLLPFVMSTVIDQYRAFDTHPISALVALVFETLMILFFHYLMIRKIFFYLNNEKDFYYADV